VPFSAEQAERIMEQFKEFEKVSEHGTKRRNLLDFHKQTLQSVIQRCQDYVAKEQMFFRFKGKLIQVQISSLEDTSILVIVFSDITQIKHMEAYTAKVKNLYQASVAHELRTPINSILPMAEALKGKIKD